jgi:TetR/AcrR family transcriptional repressor of nem operon
MGRVSDARERLLEATIDLIRKQGLGGVTVDAICDLSNVKKGSFYHFFESKEALLLAVLEEHWSRRRPELDRLFSPLDPPLDRLRNYFADVYRWQLELKQRYGYFVGCLFSSVGAGAGETLPQLRLKVQEILSRYERYYVSALKDAQARGELRLRTSAEVVDKSKALFAFMEGVLAQARIHDDPEMVRKLGQEAFRFLGLESPARQRRG